ncbi:MAG: IS1595 family transposase [Bryobacterales bacterium]
MFEQAPTKARKIAKGKLATGGTVGKAIVMGVLERHGEARVKVVADRRASSVIPEIVDNVLPGSAVYTDDLRSYRELVADYAHEFIDHTEAYVKGRVHTNGLENFWSLFKRTLKGAYVSVEPFHLQAYADEQAFRFNKRKTDDGHRFTDALRKIGGKRITFAELTGRELDSQPS